MSLSNSFGSGFTLSVIKTGVGTSCYHADGLGSIVAISNASKNIVQRYSYEAFGQLTASDPTFDNFYTYTGREYDKETGLYYCRARYYDAMEGRFVSKDTIGFAGGDVNLYNYVGGNPIRNIDPWGLAELCSAPAFGWMPFDHHWVETDEKSAGMGPPGDEDAGNNSALPYSKVVITDHSEKTDGDCREIDGVDDNKVNEMLEIGVPIGKWRPFNQCQSFARDVLFQSALPGKEGLVRESYYGNMPIAP